jgi:hypothetical protein
MYNFTNKENNKYKKNEKVFPTNASTQLILLIDVVIFGKVKAYKMIFNNFKQIIKI